MIQRGDRAMKSGTRVFIEDGIKMKKHNKLVRDKIPEIIEKSGKTAVIHILEEADYIKALEEKLNEEVAEYQASKSLEEMADILEVLQTICVSRGYSLEQLEEKRKSKSKERGGFQNRIFLEAVIDCNCQIR